MPESELPWLVAGLPVYYHRSNGDRVSAIVIGPSPRGGRRVSIRYELGGEEVLYEHAPEEWLEFAIVTAESPDSPQPVHHGAPMDALLEPQLPEVEAEAPAPCDNAPSVCHVSCITGSAPLSDSCTVSYCMTWSAHDCQFFVLTSF